MPLPPAQQELITAPPTKKYKKNQPPPHKKKSTNQGDSAPGKLRPTHNRSSLSLPHSCSFWLLSPPFQSLPGCPQMVPWHGKSRSFSSPPTILASGPTFFTHGWLWDAIDWEALTRAASHSLLLADCLWGQKYPSLFSLLQSKVSTCCGNMAICSLLQPSFSPHLQ